MRIGFFSDSYLPNVDGVVRSIVDYRRELEERGHEVYVFTSGTEAEKKANRDPNIFYYRSIKFPAYPQYKLALFPYYSTRKKARELGLDVIHCHTMASMGIAGRDAAGNLGIPSAATFHTLLPKGIQTITKRKWTRRLGEAFLWRAMKWFYSPFDVVTTPSKTLKKLLSEKGIDSVVVPNGVDVRKFQPINKNSARRRVSKKIGLQKGEKIVLTAGRLSREKQNQVILHAAPLVLQQADCRFVFTGDGPAKKELMGLSKKLGLEDKVAFTGFVPEGELPFFYSAADVFATASTFETQGLAFLEAMACGTPVVGANSLAIPEVVKRGRNGFLFPAFHSHECAEKLVKMLLLDKKNYSKFSESSRVTAEKFSLDKTTEKLLRVYERLV